MARALLRRGKVTEWNVVPTIEKCSGLRKIRSHGRLWDAGVRQERGSFSKNSYTTERAISMPDQQVKIGRNALKSRENERYTSVITEHADLKHAELGRDILYPGWRTRHLFIKWHYHTTAGCPLASSVGCYHENSDNTILVHSALAYENAVKASRRNGRPYLKTLVETSENVYFATRGLVLALVRNTL